MLVTNLSVASEWLCKEFGRHVADADASLSLDVNGF